MTDRVLFSKLNVLPQNLKKEVLHYVEFLLQRSKKDKPEKKVPEYGSLKGTFNMAPDFEEPLEDFKDYM